ncbi:hypothetical protein ACFSKW_54695 [Nonomuraea mangrovi]|uniref:Lsr2 family protein n=1 Tax=Nonomuraea mangrovi TaxID=2316207 RepID=A0ABW4TEQ1_9ACTN
MRAAGGHVAERIAPEPGSDEEQRLDQLAADPASGWRRIEDVEGAVGHGAAPSTPTAGGRPRKNASEAVWRDWAVSHGMDREQADDLTKAQLIELADQLEEE